MSTLGKSARWCALGFVAMVVAAAAARGQDEQDELAKLRYDAAIERIKALEDKMSAPDMFRVYWKDGLKLTTPDGKFDLKIGGRLHYESEWNTADEELEQTRRYTGDSGVSSPASATTPIGPLEDGAQLRRARLYISGLVYQKIEFKFQYDWAKGAVGHRDVYAGVVNAGDWIPNIRAGHQYEPFGLDSQTSSNDSVFVERSAISNIISPNRNPGVKFWKTFKDGNAEDRVTWHAGVFREDASDNSVSTADGGYNLTARVTGTPYWKEKGKQMVHVGVAGTRRDAPGRGTEGVTYAGKPEVDLFGNFVNTGAMKEAQVDWRMGGELAAIWNRWCLSSEYMLTRTDLEGGSALDNPSFSGWYAQLAYTITGEARGWKPAEAVFQNPKPFANLFEGGIGAWEVAARFSNIDLTDGSVGSGGVEGGELDMITLALNWYLNPVTRLMFDVSRIDLDNVDSALGAGGDTTVAQMRVQFAF